MRKLRTDRIGERRKNRKGLWMKIIAYRRTDDIDVRFDDGAIRQGYVL